MFLSKKNAVFFNKPKNADPAKVRRILAGWEDDEEDKHEDYQYNDKNEQKPAASNLLMGEDFVDLSNDRQDKKQKKERFYLNWDALDALTDIECEKRLIEEIVEPGGIRIKPNDNMLNNLLKEIKGMDVHVIGSLLLSKLEVNYAFPIKAKALYTIEFLIKKNEKYLSYFKAQVDKLNEFPEPQDNVENYRKILKVVLNFIGVSNPPALEENQQKFVYVDPGYNDEPKSKISNFIQQNANKTKKTEPKKAIIGPGQSKPKIEEKKPQQNSIINNDFFSLDLLGTGTQNTNKNLYNLESNGHVQPAQNNNINLLF